MKLEEHDIILLSYGGAKSEHTITTSGSVGAYLYLPWISDNPFKDTCLRDETGRMILKECVDAPELTPTVIADATGE